MVENNTIIMISRKWFKVKRVCNFNAKPFWIKQEMNEFKEMIELSEAKKTAMSKIRGNIISYIFRKWRLRGSKEKSACIWRPSSYYQDLR